MSATEIEAALSVANGERCKPPLDEAEVRKIAGSVSRYEPGEDAGAAPAKLMRELTEKLALDTVGLHVKGVALFGRGSNAVACIDISDGSRVMLDPLGKFSSPIKLSIELALQAGAEPKLKSPDVMRVMALVHKLADHHETLDVENRAADYGISYLHAANAIPVRMADQDDRWRAFAQLDELDPVSHAYIDRVSVAATSKVLVDTDTGIRYVRASWFAAYVRQQAGPGAADETLRALQRVGWRKSGSEGRIKATAPGRCTPSSGPSSRCRKAGRNGEPGHG